MRNSLGSLCGLGLMCCSWAVVADDGTTVPRSVTIEVVIASGPREAVGGEMTPTALLELEKAGKLDWLTRLRLATVENEKAQVQVSERAPVITGRLSRGGFPGGDGGQQNVTTVVNVGTTIETIAQIADDGTIVINLTAEKTWLEPASPPAEGGEGPPAPLPAQRTSTLTAKSTVRAKSGEPTLVAAQSTGGKSGNQTWIVLTATAAAAAPPRAAAAAPVHELKIFQLRFAAAADVAKILSSIFDKAPLKIGVDERTNSVLVQGPAERLPMVEALLLRLDEPSLRGEAGSEKPR